MVSAVREHCHIVRSIGRSARELRPDVIVLKCESAEVSGMERTRLEILVSMTAVLLTSQIAAADSFVHAKVARRSAPIPECFNTTTVPNQGIGTGCEIDGDSGFAPVVGSAFAQANGVGLLGTSGRLSSENSDGGNWEAIGFAEGTDTVRISAIGLTGTQGAADFCQQHGRARHRRSPGPRSRTIPDREPSRKHLRERGSGPRACHRCNEHRQPPHPRPARSASQAIQLLRTLIGRGRAPFAGCLLDQACREAPCHVPVA